MPSQYADPFVSRAKFEREIAEYRGLAADYLNRGWLLVEAQFPKVMVVLAAPKLKPAVVVMGVAFDYVNYDAAPPSVRIVNPFTGDPYKFKDLPTPLLRALPQQEFPLPGAAGGPKMLLQPAQPYMQAHSPEEIPFLCVAGVREYHEHPAHSGDVWELHRRSGAGRLVRLLDIISHYGIEPIVDFHVQLVPQVGLKFGAPPS